MKLNIRAKLALRFTVIVASILILFSASVYYFSATYRETEFYARIRDKALTTAGLLIKVDEVSLNLLKIIDKNTVNALYDEQVVVYSANDTLMYTNHEENRLEISAELLRQIRKEKEVRFARDQHEIIGVLYENRNEEFVVIASALDKYGKSKLNNLKWVLVTGGITSIILTILASMLYAGRALKPMSNVVKEVDKITIANLNTRVNEGNGEDEIAQLAITFNKMLARLESAFYMQRSFVSNASHELRTPLTSITSQIEVTLMKERTEDEYVNILNSVLDDIRNLNSLSNGLLDLAKVSSDLNSYHYRKFRIDELLWVSRAEILKGHQDYNIEIIFGRNITDESKLNMQGNEYLTKIAIMNLMDNGCKYSEDKSVNIELDIEDRGIIIKFSDHGIGIHPEDIKHIFDPFYRAENAKHISGHGLGLSLTGRIVEIHQGSIEINSIPDKGTIIRLTFPSHS